MNVTCLAGLGVLMYALMLAAEAAQCGPGVSSIEVATPIDLEVFIDALACNETSGVFDITWYGRQQVGKKIVVSGMKDVVITGVALLNTAPAVANDAGIETGMFVASGGSTLSFRNITFEGGRSKEGAAISVVNASVVNLFDCAFNNNTAAVGGDRSFSNRVG